MRYSLPWPPDMVTIAGPVPDTIFISEFLTEHAIRVELIEWLEGKIWLTTDTPRAEILILWVNVKEAFIERLKERTAMERVAYLRQRLASGRITPLEIRELIGRMADRIEELSNALLTPPQP